MRHENTKKLFDYWNSLRQGRPAPDRREIEPSDIRDILGETFILETDPVYGNVNFRLAGTRLCDLYGMELKGLGFLSLWREVDNMKVYSRARNVFDNTLPCVLSYDFVSEDNQKSEYEMVLFPLLNGRHNALRILGAAFPIIPPGRTGPGRFKVNHLRHAREFNPDQVTNPALFQASRPVPREKPTMPGRKIAHLTVIDGGITV